jgi:hypothetical protein
MHPNSVTAPVIAPVTIECEFWPEGDGWAGANTQLKLVVQGNSFEEAKKHMEAALSEKMLVLLEQHGYARTG